MCISTKRIERISEKYDVPITTAPDDADTLNVRTNSMMKFKMITSELAWNDEIAGIKMVMVGD